MDATSLAEAAGSARCLNVVMLGMLAGSDLLPFASDPLIDTILAGALPGLAEVNRAAFLLGRDAVREVKTP
jgi:Pyruvate/2-oxoacid:ferredoxin oxidoreductase gamma subunit